MGLADRLRRLFSSDRLDDAVAEREEYGVPAADERELDRTRYSSYAGEEAARTAEAELDELGRPPDPAP